MDTGTKREFVANSTTIANAYDRLAARTSTSAIPDDDEDDVVEQDPEG